jgi:CheY-like chemotaxis protein
MSVDQQLTAGAGPDDGGLPHSILLAEDELLVRLCIAQELRNVGYIVHEAADAGEALSIVGKENVELLITDIQMPGSLNGLELAKQVREAHPHTRIVLMSGNITRKTEKFDGSFTKPIRISDLIVGIRELLPETV